MAVLNSAANSDAAAWCECTAWNNFRQREIAFLNEEVHLRTAMVSALVGTVLLEIDVDALRQSSAGLLQAAFARAFMRAMVGRVRHADQRYLDLVARSRS